MNIKLADSWLREHLNSKASPQEIAKYLSLSGPSVESLKRVRVDWVYDIEVTTNRVDMVSVRGIAREAAAILPRFGIEASLAKIPFTPPQRGNMKMPIEIKNDRRLIGRIMAVAISNFENWETPEWMVKRLRLSGVRSLTLPVDITNYVMLETGHPTHIFDLDKLGKKLVVRESKKGEVFVGLDGRKYSLPQGAIVFEDGTGRITDLPGILGAKNSVLTKDSKNALFFIENTDPVRIRRTSMKLAIRTLAATMNEKGVDPRLAELAMIRGVEMFAKLAGGTVSSNMVDIYPAPKAIKTITLEHGFINERMGLKIPKLEINKILTALEFTVSWRGQKLSVTPPSFRAQDVEIPEDIVEEVARIWGYQNIPPKLMGGALPEIPHEKGEFALEGSIREKLVLLRGVEVYTQSLVGEKDSKSLELKNPLGADSKYLRTTLGPSLTAAANENLREKKFHLFEIANVYLRRRGRLPEEKMMLAGIFAGYNIREAKGVLATLGKHVAESIEQIDNYLFYEVPVGELKDILKPKLYAPIPKYPPQVEDITFKFASRPRAGEVLSSIANTKLVGEAELRYIYKKAYTFRIYYQHPDKTLTNSEVEKIRTGIINVVTGDFGGELA